MTRYFYFATLLLMAVIIGRLPVAAEQDTTPPPSTFLPLHEIGADWTEDEYTAGVALGDIDADGFDEMAIARHTTEGPRVFLLDDATAGFAPLATFGDGWGEAAWPTAVAFGNVDDDPAEELVVARVSPVNERAQVFDDANAGYVVLHNIGKEWPVGVNAVGVAFGDVDGDGRDELGLVTDATAGNRIFILDDVTAAFAPLWAYGDGAWGAAAKWLPASPLATSTATASTRWLFRAVMTPTPASSSMTARRTTGCCLAAARRGGQGLMPPASHSAT